MQLEVIGIILRCFQFIKDIMAEPFRQINTFCWRKEIFRYDVAGMAIRDVISCCIQVSMLNESQQLLFYGIVG